MSQNGHTPGPWCVEVDGINDTLYVRVDKKAKPWRYEKEATAADLALINAAPELLEFAEAVAYYEEYLDDAETFANLNGILRRLEARARAVLFKATKTETGAPNASPAKVVR